jgi:isoquinoline 1-oxidoreductase beta subunit
MPMLIAEELEVDLPQVRVEHAAPTTHISNLVGFQMTGDSTSVQAFWEPLRRAGATARTMLVMAAAQVWSVEPGSCRAANGMVIHVPTGRKLAYGALVDGAAKLPVPDRVTLKEPRDFNLIGRPTKRLDTADKVNGKAVFGIDVKIPGMKIATVAACPVFGGKLARLDDSRAKAVKGVRQVVRLDNAVAVVADHMGAARKGLAALEITWDAGPNSQLSPAELVAHSSTLPPRGPASSRSTKAMCRVRWPVRPR